VTRGALYHQFRDKEDLFAAVFELLESELAQRTAAAAGASGTTDPLTELRVGAEAWLDACTEPEIQRIVLLDGPAVLGWERWREIGTRYGRGLVEAVLQAAVDAGRLAPQPIRPLAHVLMGAVDEAALYVATADDPAAARVEVGAVLDHLITSLAAPRS
jgi:AcrR family transcriptional regulator